jgi:outer membrane protein OmpA-like peptidoglycan-associated protein
MKKTNYKSLFNQALLLITLTLVTTISFAAKKDVKGSKDHPMVSRYPGSHIIVYRAKDYDEYTLPLGKKLIKKGKETFAKSRDIEGKLTRIAYVLPENTSTLKVYRNFENAFNKAGFTKKFSCKKSECGSGGLWQHFFLKSQVWGAYDKQRLYVGELKKGSKTIYVVFYVGDQERRVTAELDVIETKRMETDLIKVDPKNLGAALDTQGKVAIYGIYFDTDKATLKPSSKPALDAIAKLLSLKPGLKLYVVGHTDDQGSLQHNMTLSSARARTVVGALVEDYKINSNRLIAFGTGPYSPVQPNTSEQGRAKNRRVELVKRLK